MTNFQPKGKLFSGGKELKIGSEVQTFRGETVTVVDWFLPGMVARGARVMLRYPEGDENTYFTGVISAEIRHNGETFTS